MSELELNRSLEAILMVVDEPVNEVILAQITEVPTEVVTAALKALALSYEEQGRGFQLREVAGGWRFYSHRSISTGGEVRSGWTTDPPDSSST